MLLSTRCLDYSSFSFLNAGSSTRGKGKLDTEELQPINYNKWPRLGRKKQGQMCGGNKMKSSLPYIFQTTNGDAEYVGSCGPHRQACTTTMSLFLWELCRTVSWTSPRGYWLGAEPLERHQRKSVSLPEAASEFIQHG